MYGSRFSQRGKEGEEGKAETFDRHRGKEEKKKNWRGVLVPDPRPISDFTRNKGEKKRKRKKECLSHAFGAVFG